MKVVLAGAVTVFGLEELKKSFASLGMSVSFADAPFMAPFASKEEKSQINFTDHLPQDVFIIPLSEFWISYCTKHSNHKISQNALKASRSKKFLARLLSAFDTPEELTRTQALHEIQQGAKIIVKPEGLHSGYGVEVIDSTSVDMLDKYISEAKSIRNRTLRIMEIPECDVMLTRCIPGTEYSADCFIYQGRVTVVRVCKKQIMVLNNKPCAAVIELVEPDSVTVAHLTKWCNAIFDGTDISFAQFDFIVEQDTFKYYPIDFACRVGGGMKELLSHCKINPYAAAVNENANQNDFEKFVQLNYLSSFTGYVEDDNYKLAEGDRYVYKHKGDYVISNPSSVGSRVAIVICRQNPIKDMNELLIKK